jgi:hypothetical protein
MVRASTTKPLTEIIQARPAGSRPATRVGRIPARAVLCAARLGSLRNNQTPPGTVIGTFSAGDVTYDIYRNPKHDPGTGAGGSGWQFIAFVARSPVRSGTIELKPFVDNLVTTGYITGPRYYAGVELGTEILNGAGSAIISSFSVGVTP